MNNKKKHTYSVRRVVWARSSRHRRSRRSMCFENEDRPYKNYK